jgi:hypothetical protein
VLNLLKAGEWALSSNCYKLDRVFLLFCRQCQLSIISPFPAEFLTSDKITYFTKNYFVAGGERSLTTFAGILAHLTIYPMIKMYFKAYIDT